MNPIIYLLIYVIPIFLLCWILGKPKKKDEFLITGFTSEYYAIGFVEKIDGPVVNKNIKCTEYVFKDLHKEIK